MEYIAFLSKKLGISGLVFNYLSGARTWVTLNQGRTAAFDSYHIRIVKKGVANIKRNKPVQAIPMKERDIKNICKVLQ